LMRTVPPAMPGIFFLSGETALNEDNEEVATINLSKMNELFKAKMPWHLSFSYGKALQKTCIVTWLGKAENKAAAQKLSRHGLVPTLMPSWANTKPGLAPVLAQMAISTRLQVLTESRIEFNVRKV